MKIGSSQSVTLERALDGEGRAYSGSTIRPEPEKRISATNNRNNWHGDREFVTTKPLLHPSIERKTIPPHEVHFIGDQAPKSPYKYLFDNQ